MPRLAADGSEADESLQLIEEPGPAAAAICEYRGATTQTRLPAPGCGPAHDERRLHRARLFGRLWGRGRRQSPAESIRSTAAHGRSPDVRPDSSPGRLSATLPIVRRF